MPSIIPPRPSESPVLFPEALAQLIQDGAKQQPLVIEDAFPAEFLTEQDTYEAWHTFVKGLPPERWGSLARFYRGSELIADVEPFLPTASDISWDSYLKRLGDETGSFDWGLFLTDPQLSSAKIFRRLLAFLTCLYEHLGMPCGGCIPDLFMMNHEASFFRLHKDAQDVYTFVISGRRRFLLWPFETFSSVAGMKEAESRKPNRLEDVDIEAYRSQATIIEGSAGDLLYWPAEWWHVGESDGERAITLAVGTLPEIDPLQRISAAARRLESRRDRPATLCWSSSDGVEPTVAAHIDWIQDLLAEDRLWAEIRRGVMSWVTRCGLNRIPPPLRRRAPLDDDQWIEVASPSMIAFDGESFKSSQSGQERTGGAPLFCSITGHDLLLTPGEPAMVLVSLLGRGGVFRVGTLIEEALEGSEVDVDRERMRRLLETIGENYGFEVLTEAPTVAP